MMKMRLSASARWPLLAVAALAPLAVAGPEHRRRQRQAGAEVARRHAAAQVQKQAARAASSCRPSSSKLVRDKVVHRRDPRRQEAEQRGLGRVAPTIKQQMELARQSILIATCSRRLRQEDHGHRRRDPEAEYDKFKAQASRHRIPRAPHPGREGRRRQGADRPAQGRRQVRGPGEEELQGPRLRRERRRPRLRQARRLRSRVLAGDGQAEEGRDRPTTPVKTQFGYHIIKLEDTREAQFPPLADVKPQIQQRLAQEKAAAVPRRASRQGEDRLQVHELTRARRLQRRGGRQPGAPPRR